MKNIAIFCDGTWQQLDQPWPTNVAKLARAVKPRDADGGDQVVYYDDGVGVSAGVLDAATHLIGGALGKGLDYKIVRAYEFLCLNYEPGDRIFIFGFSRGAYTARSLGGLIRLTWIVKREEAGSAFEAMSFYRSTPPPDATAAVKAQFQADVDAFKLAHSHPGNAFTDVKAYDKTDPGSLSPDDKKRAWLQYVGVWETVGSLGIPANLLFAKELDQQYRFYNTDLSRFVRSARHAVAIDERRKTFSPTLWTNIAVLNANASADGMAYDERPYQQQWFPGTHGLVGGGIQDGGLSLVPMLWIAEGASRAGLAFDLGQLQDYAAHAHPDVPMPKDGFSLGEFMMELDGVADRDGPADFAEVSLSARLRWAALPAYRPKPLQQLRIELGAWQAPANPRFYQP